MADSVERLGDANIVTKDTKTFSFRPLNINFSLSSVITVVFLHNEFFFDLFKILPPICMGTLNSFEPISFIKMFLS